MRSMLGYCPPNNLSRVPAGYFSCRSRSSPSSAKLASAGEATPRTQKITRLLGGSGRVRARRLQTIGIRAALRNRDRVTDGEAVCGNENLLHEQPQNLLSFAYV